MRIRGAAIEIHKFGGASLADGPAYRHAAEIIGARRCPTVVVVSAPFGVTDQLLAMATEAIHGRPLQASKTVSKRFRAITATAGLLADSQRSLDSMNDRSFHELEQLLRSVATLRELTSRTRDQIVARGELLSAAIFAAVLQPLRPSQLVAPNEVILTDGKFGGASPDQAATNRAARRLLPPLLVRGKVVIVPGFLGAATDATELATLGRGGSDLTATLLARALGAPTVSLWKDVPGLLTADPRLVPDARIVPQLHTREAAELAYYGAKVLHPRALIPLPKSARLFIRPVADPDAPGTEVSARRTLEKYPVKSLSAIGGQALLTVAGNGILGVPGVAARAFAALSQAGTSVSLITQASSEQSICFTVPEASAKRACACLSEAFREELTRREIEAIEVRTGLSTVAVVGLGMAGQPGIAARVFAALARGGINVVAIAQGSSELNISIVVDSTQAAPAQREIHDAFQLAKIGGGTALERRRGDIVLLGFGQIGRALAGLITRVKDPPLRVVGILDTTGLVLAPEGLSARKLAQLAKLKQAGKTLAQAGWPLPPSEAIAEIARHALGRPILVDVTAAETAPVIRQALNHGMDVVLANKRPIGGARADSEPLLAAAQTRRLRFEATVGAGLPILDTYRKLAESGDRILKIEGCLSGTLGFLMSEVSQGRRFSAALRQAMALGYTEPDPRDDLSGIDTARKALILGRLLGYRGELAQLRLQSLVPPKLVKLPRERFLAQLEILDEEWQERALSATKRSGVLRYVATATRSQVSVELKVVDGQSPFAALRGTDNQVAFTTIRYRKNPLIITGPGAGLAVTAGGVLNDIVELARSQQTS